MMKKTLVVALVALCSLLRVSGVQAQNSGVTSSPFEGTISYALEIPQLGEDKMDLKINVKGENMMTEMDLGMMGPMHMYLNRGTKKMSMVMDAMKMGYTMDYKDAANSTEKVEEKDIDFKATGKKETINGYTSEEYTANTGDGTWMNFWLTSDGDPTLRSALRDAMANMQQQQQSPKNSKLFKMIADKGMMAVRTVVSKDGEKMMAMDLVKIEKKTLNDNIFTPPTDVKFQPMPKMPQGGEN